MSDKKKDLWTYKDAARHYDVTYDTVKRWKRIKDPRLQIAETPGRGVRIVPPVRHTATGTN